MPRLIVRFLAFLLRPVADEWRRQHKKEVDERLAATVRAFRESR